MKIKRITAVLLAAMMLATVFTGCGGNSSSTASGSNSNTSSNSDPLYGEDNVKLKVWAPDKAKDLTQTLCDNFSKEMKDKYNKTVKVEVVVQGESDAATNLRNDSTTAADVFGFASDQLNLLVDAGVITPVFKNANDVLGLSADTVKAANSELSVNAATVDGTLYAFPETGDNGYYLMYNKKYVTDEDAKTMEGIFAACEKAGKKFSMDAGNGFYACMFAFTGGLKTNGIVDDTQQFNDYDETQVVASMESFAKLFHKYSKTLSSVAANKVVSQLSEGVCAAGIDGSWDTKAAMEALGDDFGAVKLPTINIGGKDTQIVSMHGYKMIGVNKSSKFPETAQLLANYLTNEESQLKRAQELYWGPSNTKAAANEVVTSNIAIKAILEQSKYSVPQVAVTQQFWDPMANLGNKLYSPDAKYDTATLTKLLKDTITNIKDE